MTTATVLETLNLTSEGLTAEIREVVSDTESWIEVVSSEGELIVALGDDDCSNLVKALSNVWRARAAKTASQAEPEGQRDERP